MEDINFQLDSINYIKEEKETKNVFYGNSKTLYFRIKDITSKQEKDLLNKGKNYIDIENEVYIRRKGDRYLMFNVLKLKKVQNSSENIPLDN